MLVDLLAGMWKKGKSMAVEPSSHEVPSVVGYNCYRWGMAMKDSREH